MAGNEQSRARILGRMEEALDGGSGPCGSGLCGSGLRPERPGHRPGPHETIGYREIYAIDDPNVLQRFSAECTANLTECRLTSGPAETAAIVNEVLASLPAGPVFAQDAPTLRGMAAHWGREVAWSSAGGPPEPSQACVTLCEALVAQTGSVLVSAETGGRGASVVAPVHVVVARQAQLFADLESAMRDAFARGVPQRNSFVGLISGSSRTADIEKILVLGAHGPRRVVVVVEK